MVFFPRKTYIIVLIVLTSSLMPVCAAYAASPQVRVSIDTNQSYWAGQKIPFYIDLLSPGYFSGTPKFDVPEIPGVLVMKIPGSPVMGTEEIDGSSFTTQRHEFVLFSQRPGQVAVPSCTVSFGVSGQAAASPKEVTLKTSSLTLTPKMPPGAEKLGTIISTRDLKITEKWDPAPKDAETGHAFTRTITFQAPDIPGMAFPPMPQVNIPGVGIYPETPVVSDRMERGDFIGKRSETISYVMENAGKKIIPAVKFHWFDIASETLKSEQLPEVTFKVSSSTVERSSGQPSGHAAGGGSFPMIFAMVFGLTTICAAVFWRWRTSLIASFNSWQKYRADSESSYFKQLIMACRKNDPHGALNALMKWVDRVYPDRQTVTLAWFVEAGGDPELMSEIVSLQKTCFYQEKESGSGKIRISWSGRKLLPLMKKARKRLKIRNIRGGASADLMPLNPS